MANQLRAHLQTTLPGAIGLFRDIDSPITLAFLTRFTTPAKAYWLSPHRLQTWLGSAGYTLSRWSASPEPRPPHASQARSKSSRSAGRSTSSSAAPSPTSPATPTHDHPHAGPHPGPSLAARDLALLAGPSPL